MTAPTRPRVVTFYSYKGGTGRTMAVANVAWILASQGKRVLAIDWDLEAPGLHRYFAPFLSDPTWERTEGLIDFLIRYTLAAGRPTEGERPAEDRWYARYADLAPYTEPVNCVFQGSGRVDLVGAGRQDESYPARVHHFDWHLFYGQFGGGAFLDEMLLQLVDSYDYVLIDSRTGVSDTSGICTVHLPDTLVVLYTLNNQSIEGASGVALDALRQRRAREAGGSGDAARPPFVVFPVATRIELAEKEKLTRQRELGRRRFRPLIEHAVRLGRIEGEEEYFGRMEVLYDPFYAYGEVLATIADRPNQANSVLATMELLTSFVTHGEITRLAPSSTTRQSDALRRYEAFARADNPAEVEPVTGEYDVFISSTRETRELSREMHAALAPWTRVFEPNLSLRPGDSFASTTEEAIDHSRVVLLLAGADIPEAQQRELERARGSGRRIVPVLVGDAPPPSSPPWLGELLHVRVDAPWGASDVARLSAQVLRAAGLEPPPPPKAERAAASDETTRVMAAAVAPSGTGEAGAPFPARAAPRRHGRRWLGVGAMALIGALVTIVALGLLLMRSDAGSANDMLAALRDGGADPAARADYLRELYSVGARSFPDAHLAGVDLSEADLRGVDLRRADLTGAVLLGAALDSALLDGATLASARLGGASLTHASLRDVALDSVDLRGANLFGTNVSAEALQKARTDATTILPDSTFGPIRRDDDTGISVAVGAAPSVRGDEPRQPAGVAGSGGSAGGWVWIGDFDRAAGAWTRPRLETLEGVAVGEDPALMKPGSEYRVAGTLVIREALPPDDADYFRTVPRSGTAARGSVVVTTGPPVARDREYAVQYWAPVRLTCDAERESCAAGR